MKKQYDCVDATKLLLSLFIVAIHADLFGSALFPTLRLAVPVFFIFTGFFAFSRIDAAAPADRKKALWRIEKRYLQLYLFWFVVLLPITVYVRKYYAYRFPSLVLVFAKHLLWSSTFPTSWYLMACILGVAAVYLLSKANQAVTLCIGILTYFLTTCVSKYASLIADNSFLYALYSKLSLVVGNPSSNVFVALIYIVLGRNIAAQKFKLPPKKHCFLGFILCYFGLLLEFACAKNQPWFSYRCDCWFMLAPTALFFVLSILSLDIKIPHAPVIRSMSTIIYCSHMPIMMVASEVFSICNIADPQNTLLFSIGLVGPCLLSFVLLSLEKHRKLKFLKYSH